MKMEHLKGKIKNDKTTKQENMIKNSPVLFKSCSNDFCHTVIVHYC